jgi:diacylglycerol kinase (ATP)
VNVKRARLILNPAAGRDRALAHAADLNASLKERYGIVEIVVTVAPGDCEAAATRAVEDGVDVLLVGGGDGTLNEAVNGVAAVAGGLEAVTFGIVPLGTGNDFAQTLGVPLDVDGAIDILQQQHVVTADLGRLNGRHFVNVSGGGFIAEVSDAVTPQLKSIAGRLAYLVGGVQALLDFDPIRMSLRGDPGGHHIDTGVYAFAVCNAQQIGGGRLIAPRALIDDGLLDVCVIESMPTLEFVALLRKVTGGDHVDDPRVRYMRVSTVTMEFERPILVNTDGEVLEASTCHYSVQPRVVRFFARGPGASDERSRGDDR